ncbi:MAG: 5-oxoprolinase subunit PxpA, partial [bacterium]
AVRIDLNSDLGEGAGTDEQLLPLISSANIACGGHAGDKASMAKTVRLSIEYGVGVGAHPSFPDREGFGRRAIRMNPEELRETLARQMDALQSVADRFGVNVQHVKVHGALYNQAAADPSLAALIGETMRAINPGLIVVALAGSVMADVLERIGVRVAREAFIDRGYAADGALVPRDRAHALVTEPHEAAFRAVRLARDGLVAAEDGTEIAVQSDTLCIHGDNPSAVLLARAVRRALDEAEITVTPMASLV